MLGPFRAYRRIILCRDLRLNYHRRILRFGRRGREISRPGVSWGRNGLENHYFLVHIPQLRTKRLLTRYRRAPRGRPQYRRQGERSFRGDVASWGYLSRVVLVASSRKKTADELVEGDPQELDNAGERQPIRISRRKSIRILLRFRRKLLAARGRRRPEKIPAVVGRRSPCPST